MKSRLHSPTPYFDTWLARTRKQLTASGKLAQVATVLASQDGTTPEAWQGTLRAMLAEQIAPGIEVLVRIDNILAGSPKRVDHDSGPPQPGLFG